LSFVLVHFTDITAPKKYEHDADHSMHPGVPLALSLISLISLLTLICCH